MKKINVLVTNDDGFDAVGLKVLVSSLQKVASVYTVAPDYQNSSVSHSLNLKYPVFITRENSRLFKITGTPADCVRLGVLEIYKKVKFDLILSGINYGANMGEDVLYSGTVAAARESVLLNIPGIAVSLVCDNDNFQNYKPAGDVVKKVVSNLLVLSKKTGCKLWNINVPNITVKTGKLKGICFTKLGKRVYDNKICVTKNPRGTDVYWLMGRYVSGKSVINSDITTVEKGYVSVTPMITDTTNNGVLDSIIDMDLLKK
ncbi:MAG: 5'/3'-nucleotidase SurE [Elusimicrobiota bacterium]